MECNFIIRRATLEDASAIQEITKEAFSKYISDAGLSGKIDFPTESLEDIKKDIEEKAVFIAIIDGLAVGTIRVEVLPDGCGYISRFGVRLNYHNIGVGQSLMNVVDKYLESKNVKKVCLHTASGYRKLMRFYYGVGFHVDSTSKDRGYTRALMIKEL
jgi:predicted N-acetyltransferase YhbS